MCPRGSTSDLNALYLRSFTSTRRDPQRSVRSRTCVLERGSLALSLRMNTGAHAMPRTQKAVVVQVHEKHEWWMRDLLRTGDGLHVSGVRLPARMDSRAAGRLCRRDRSRKAVPVVSPSRSPEGLRLPDAVRFASGVAALATRVLGAQTALPRRRQLDTLLEKATSMHSH
jgi:hypothetical protein